MSISPRVLSGLRAEVETGLRRALGRLADEDLVAQSRSKDAFSDTGLSRIKWLFVIARNSSFFYKGKATSGR